MELGAAIVARDLIAVDHVRDGFFGVKFSESVATALDGADACLVATAWPEYAELDEAFDRMSSPVVVDGRRCIDRRDGLVYEGLTW